MKILGISWSCVLLVFSCNKLSAAGKNIQNNESVAIKLVLFRYLSRGIS